MENKLIIGVLLALAVALMTPPAMAAIDTYGNTSVSSANITVTSNVSIIGISFMGCIQTTVIDSNTTDRIELFADAQTMKQNDTQAQYNCTYRFMSVGDDANVSNIQLSFPENYTNLSTVKIFNYTDDASVGNWLAISKQDNEDGVYLITSNYTTTGAWMAVDGEGYNLTVFFYTNTSTISWDSSSLTGDTWVNKWLVNHPSSGGLGITKMNVTLCPTHKTAFQSQGSLIKLTRNGTTQTATTVGDCINITQDINSTYEYAAYYRTTAATGTSDTSGTGTTGPAPAVITPEQQQAIGSIILWIAIIVVIVSLIAVAAYLYSKGY